MKLLSLGAAIPIITATLLLARLSGEPRAWMKSLLMSAGLGIGLSSVVWWFLLLLPMKSVRWMIAVDLLLWSIALVVVLRVPRAVHRDEPVPPREHPRRAATWAAIVACVSVAGVAGVLFTASSVVLPHGGWDAWAIWNLRARFLFRGYPSVWGDAFSPLLAWSHPDYPLLVPLSVARGWTYVGSETVVIPILLAAVFVVGIVATSAGSVGRTVGRSRGFLTAALILASPAFINNAASQCADIPLAFYMLTTFVIIDRATASEANRAYWLIAGTCAALAGWTKNEGLAFALAVFAMCALWAFRSQRWNGLRRLTPLFIGAAPVFVAVLIFKCFFAPPNDLVAAQSLDHVLSRLTNLHRVQVVLGGIGHELWFGGATTIGVIPILSLYLLVVGVRRPIGAAPLLGLAAMLAMLLADAFAYLTTPYNLAWHMRTSVDRVLVQVFPTIVWCAMMMANPPALPAKGLRALRFSSSV